MHRCASLTKYLSNNSPLFLYCSHHVTRSTNQVAGILNFAAGQPAGFSLLETTRHFHTHVTEHLDKDKESHVYKHLRNNPQCMNVYDNTSFTILDQARTEIQLKIKEGMYPMGKDQVRSGKIR